jgi:hypothetical protein
MTTELEVLREAQRAFRRYDKARADLRAAEDELRKLCRAYDLASGCRGLRPESLRITVENRLGKRAA